MVMKGLIYLSYVLLALLISNVLEDKLNMDTWITFIWTLYTFHSIKIYYDNRKTDGGLATTVKSILGITVVAIIITLYEMY